jgi:hypothetical protein
MTAGNTKLTRWAVYSRTGKPATYLGVVTAHSAAAAMEKAIELFSIPPEKQNTMIVAVLDAAQP